MDAAPAPPTVPTHVLNVLHRSNKAERSSLISYIVQLQRDGNIAAKRRRRKWLLGHIEALPADGIRANENTYNMNFWENVLTHEERNDRAIVYKLLEHTIRHGIFGYNPWRQRRNWGDDTQTQLPRGFDQDPEAFLAFVRNANFNRRYVGTDVVPVQFRDDLAVMKAACSKISGCFLYASQRLKDNEELVIISAFSEEGWLMEAVGEASERLKNDKRFITALLEKFCTDYDHEQRKQHWYLLRYVLPLHDMKAFRDLLCVLPSEDIPETIGYFPLQLRGDAESMLQLLNRVDPSEAGTIFKCCSEEVQKDERIILSVKEKIGDKLFIKSWERQLHESVGNYEEIKLRALKDIRAKKVSSLDAIPLVRRLDSDVVQAALDHGILHNAESILAFLKELEEADFEEDDIGEFYFSLPEHHQKDENIALAIICQAECLQFDTGVKILDMVPSLKQSKKAVAAVLRLERMDRNGPDAFLSECPKQFFDDKEIMSAAAEGNDDNLELASKRLLSDREFILALSEIMNVSFMRLTTPEFQLSNLDIVEEAIDDSPNWDEEWFFHGLSPEVWTNRTLVMRWLTRDSAWPHQRKDNSILKLLEGIHPESPFLSDREIVAMSVRYDSSHFAYASNELKSDRKFVLQLAKENNRIIHHSAKELRFDEEIIVAALAKNAATIVDCFDILHSSSDMEFLLKLSLNVRLKLHLHDIFVGEFLRGTLHHDQHTLHPSLRCHLPKLDQGVETSTDMKKLIAAYLGAPVGEDYVQYKKASLALEHFGLY